ncbi:MAG: hypothetical protein WCX96_03835 [Bacilli bacterium]
MKKKNKKISFNHFLSMIIENKENPHLTDEDFLLWIKKTLEYVEVKKESNK